MKSSSTMDAPIHSSPHSLFPVKFGRFTEEQQHKIHNLLRSDRSVVEFEWDIPLDESSDASVELPSFDPAKFSYQSLTSFPCSIVPRGLINRGNTCFMNAVLQSLIHLKPFFAIFNYFSSTFGPEYLEGFDLIKAFVDLCNEFSLQESVKIANEKVCVQDLIAPDMIYEALSKKGSILKMHGNQEDAHEFLSYLIDGLHEEFVEHFKKYPDCYEVPTEMLTSSNDWTKIISKKGKIPSINRQSMISQETPISNLFTGCTRSSIKLPHIKESVTVEPYLCLQLDVEHCNDMLGALTSICKPEIVPYNVDNFVQNAIKSLSFESLPPILCINLKTFVFSVVGGSQKIDRFIPYPACFEFPSRLIHRELSDDGDSTQKPVYRLLSVIYHHGKQAGGGHYTADVLIGQKQQCSTRRNGYENPYSQDCWMRFDDKISAEVDLRQVLQEKPNQNAYILFYQLLSNETDASLFLDYAPSLAHYSNGQTEMHENAKGPFSKDSFSASVAESSTSWTKKATRRR